jgi:drug/metabolite transporter, DME family
MQWRLCRAIPDRPQQRTAGRSSERLHAAANGCKSDDDMMGPLTARGYGVVLVAVATALWATSGFFINRIIDESSVTPLGLAFWRDLVTFACLVTGVALFRPRLLRVAWRDLPWLAAMGSISIGFFHALWNVSIVTNGVSVATVVQSNAPVFVAVVAWLLWREPLTGRKLSAIALALTGTILISRLDGFGGEQITLFGLLIGLATAVTYGAFSLFGKKLTGSYDPWTILVYVFGFGTLALLPFQLAAGVELPWPPPVAALVPFAGLVLLTTIGGFALYTSGLKRLQASVAAIVATLEVPLAAMMSYLLLGERLDGWQLLGALLVVSGVIFLTWSPARTPVVATR